MDTTMLQTPRTGGRSRFSKALPMPPPSQDSFQTTISPKSQQSPRGLPQLPTMAATAAFPPRKDSVGARFASKPIDSPLPALPVKPSEPELQKKMPPIPRKAVASPPVAAQPANQEKVDTTKLKRNSSISSLLSAYSNTSSDSVQRSSQRSSDSKASEASLSPERDAMHGDGQENLARTYKAYSRNPYEEPSAREKEIMMNEPLPPPPPSKNASRPTTPRVGLPTSPRNGRPAGAPSSPSKDTGDASSQAALNNASPPRREIWRRRASSKSDRNIAVAGLKLGVSNGSTAATTAPLPASSAEPAQQALPIPPVLPSNGSVTANKASPLPPRSSSALPGRNVRPQPQQDNQTAAATTPQPPTKDSPTLKTGPTSIPDVLRPGNANAHAAKPSPNVASPLSSPEPPAKSINRPAVGSKSSPQSMQNQETPAQHLREARSAIDLKEKSRIERAQREEGQKNYPLEQVQSHDPQTRDGMPLARPRGLSNTSARKLGAAPQLTVTSPTATVTPYEPVVYKDQEPMQLTAQEEKDLTDAINKVLNRNWDWPKVSPNKNGVWPCKEMTVDHLNCVSDHKRWLHMENAHNPIACMLCHDGTAEHRRVCKTCGMRVCLPCADLLTGRKVEELDFDALVNKAKAEESAIE